MIIFPSSSYFFNFHNVDNCIVDTMNKNFTTILGIKISTLKKVEILDYIKNILDESGEQIFIATPNPEFLLESLRNERFKNILNSTSLNVPDGVGLLWASSVVDKKNLITERIPGSEIVYDIINISKNLNKKIFLLGSNSEDQLEIVKQKIGNNIVSGYSIGFHKNEFIMDYNSNELIYPADSNKLLLEKINNSGAEILFVAFGAPKQELWISENKNKLNNIKLFIGLGGTFDFISGIKKRAPKLFINLGLEWLFRLIQEPARIKRIFNAVIVFPIKVLISNIK